MLNQEKSLFGGNGSGENRTRLLLALFVLALVLRTVWLAYAQPTPWSDYEDYRRLGEALVDHQQLGFPEASGRRLPGLPTFLAAMMLVSRSVLWLSFTQVLVSSLAVVVIFELTRRLTGSVRLAAATGFVTAINPTLIMFSPVLASEHLFSLLVLVALLLAIGSTRPTPARAATIGLVLGAAILTRGESMFYVPLIAALLILAAQRPKDRVLLPLAFVMLCGLVVAPWYVRNLRVFGPGAGLSTNSGLIFYYAHNDGPYGRPNRRGTPLEGLGDVEAQRRGFELGMAYLREDPTRLVGDVVRGTQRLYSPTDYAVEANLRSPRSRGDEEWPERELAGRQLFTGAVKGFYVLSLAALPLALLAFRSYSLPVWLVVAGVPFLNWVCYAVVFMAGARYRFLAEIVFGAVMGAVVVTLWDRLRPRQTASGKRSPAVALPLDR